MGKKVNWELALSKVVVSPSGYRYPVDAAYGQQILRCSSSDVETLLAACRDVGYSDADGYDYWNFGLYSGSGKSRPELELVFFQRVFMKMRDWIAPIRHQIGFLATCPRGARCESDSWPQPDFPGFIWHPVELARGRAYWVGEIEQRGASSHVSSKLLTEAWHSTLDQYRYQYTCPELAVVVNETRRRGVGDCLALSTLLAAELHGQNIPARIHSGFLWGGTTGRAHRWVEAIDTDGGWKVFDLSTALHARYFAMTNYAEFGFGSLSNRVIRGQTSVQHPCGGTTLQVELDVRRPLGRDAPVTATQ
jgi:hypothetical protein